MSEMAVPSFGLGRAERRWGVSIALALIAVVVVIGLRVAHTSGPLHVDQLGARVVDSSRVAGDLARHHLGGLDTRRTFHRLVWLGSPQFVGVAVAALALWRVVKRDLTAAAVAAFAPLLAGALTEWVAKPLIGRRMSATGHAFAFPSGHVTGAAALAAVVVALAVRQWGRRAAWVAIPAALLPLGVSAGVVHAGFHYATDAVGGIAMGFASVLLVVVTISAVEERRARRTDALVPVGADQP
jgi:membrane-associated phospholipid phosphatase